MGNAIVNRRFNDYQLISYAIELVHKVMSLADCRPELLKDNHIAKAHEVALKWNERFIDLISKEGE